MAFRHQGYLTAPNDIPLGLTDEEAALIARYKPRAPDGDRVPMPTKADWIRLPFKDVVREDGMYRRILFIDATFERMANEISRLKAYFGCERRYRI